MTERVSSRRPAKCPPYLETRGHDFPRTLQPYRQACCHAEPSRPFKRRKRRGCNQPASSHGEREVSDLFVLTRVDGATSSRRSSRGNLLPSAHRSKVQEP